MLVIYKYMYKNELNCSFRPNSESRKSCACCFHDPWQRSAVPLVRFAA